MVSHQPVVQSAHLVISFLANVVPVRADRLVAVTLYLQRRGRVTAAELAEHLEVSVATARRDLEALSVAGVPVYPQRGRGGGWQLVGGARTDLSGLTEPEVRALFLSLAGSGGDATARAALNKLVGALPAPFREGAETAAAAVRVEPRRWQERSAAPFPDESVLREAIVQRRRCTVGYRRRGAESDRVIEIEPWRLVDKAGVAYLLAGTARGPRTYRLDRMGEVQVGEDRFERPQEAIIDEHWARTTATVDAARTSTRATVRADAFVRSILADQLGSGFGQLDGDTAVLAAHSARGLAEQLAGWGSRVEVLDAPDVVAELASIGAELVAMYGR